MSYYFRDGREHKGGMHKMPDGKLHSGKTHGKTSKRLYHLKVLPKTVQEKIRKRKKKS